MRSHFCQLNNCCGRPIDSGEALNSIGRCFAFVTFLLVSIPWPSTAFLNRSDLVPCTEFRSPPVDVVAGRNVKTWRIVVGLLRLVAFRLRYRRLVASRRSCQRQSVVEKSSAVAWQFLQVFCFSLFFANGVVLFDQQQSGGSFGRFRT